MGDKLEYLFTALVAIAIVVNALLRWQRGKPRTEAVRAVATRMGFKFEPSIPGHPRDRLGGLPLFERGEASWSANVSSGEAAGEPATVLDYSYRLSGQWRWSQTVVVCPSRGRRLPDFELHPRDYPLKYAQLSALWTIQRRRDAHRLPPYWSRSKEGIELEHSPEFSKRYLLLGEDRAAIEALFSPAVASALQSANGWSLESRDGVICAYRARELCAPEDLPKFLAEALRVVRSLAR